MKSYYYHFFGVNLEFRTNYTDFQDGFNRIFGHFLREPIETSDVICSIEKLNAQCLVRAKSDHYFFEYLMNDKPDTDTYFSLFSPVIYEVRNFFLIHGASFAVPVLNDTENHVPRSLFIAAPSGFGKSTLATKLLKEDIHFMSDELAPLNIQTGLIHSYPRGMGIRTETVKQSLEFPIEKSVDKAKPGYVIFLALENQEMDDSSRYLEIALGRIDEIVISSFKGLEGIKDVFWIKDRMFPVLRLSLEKEAKVITQIQELMEQMAIPIIYSLKGMTKPPDFQKMPTLKEMSAKNGLLELGQHILNSDKSVLLNQTFGGSKPKMMFELVSLLKDCRFFSLTVGKLDEMVALIKETLAADQ